MAGRAIMAKSKSFKGDFRHFFGRGLAILLPTVLTLWIIYTAFMFLLSRVAEPINSGLRVATVWAVPYVTSESSEPKWYDVTNEDIRARLEAKRAWPADPEKQASAIAAARVTVTRSVRHERLRDYWQDRWYLQFVGLLLAVLIIYLAGVLLGNFLGRQIYQRVERLIGRVPGFKQVYPHVKQMVDLILGEKAMAFSTVVLVEYPSKDIWTLGFLTGESMQAMDDAAGGRTVSVFIPTSPTPFTGFTINMKRDLVRVVDIPVDQALRFVLTAGVLAPDRKAEEIVARPLEKGAVAVIQAGTTKASAEAVSASEGEVQEDPGQAE